MLDVAGIGAQELVNGKVDLYQNSVDCMWKHDLSKDLEDWNTLNKDEQYFIKMIIWRTSDSNLN
jgi:ribonucleotide reductase beta subunit family protein with ferritin-like domain